MYIALDLCSQTSYHSDFFTQITRHRLIRSLRLIVVRNWLMGRGFVLTNAIHMYWWLLVGACTFIILAHVKCMHMHMHSHKHTSNNWSRSYTTINHTSSMPTFSSWGIWLFLNTCIYEHKCISTYHLVALCVCLCVWERERETQRVCV